MAVNIINRNDAAALISEQVINSIMQDEIKGSTFMQLARQLPNMTSKQTRIPVLSVLPTAYWVDGDTGRKKTSKAAWDKVFLTAAELAVIVPIPEAVLEDADYDIMGEVVPRVKEAIYKAVDGAAIFGTNIPSEWTQGSIVSQAQAAGNVVTGAITYDNLLGVGGVISKVEETGHMVTGGIASMATRAALRGIKDADGRPIFNANGMQSGTQYALDGAPLYFPANGSFDTATAKLVVGDWSQAVYAIRKDMDVKFLDQAVIQDEDGNIVYNLAQDDMVAIRCTFRMGMALPRNVSALTGEREVPFAYIDAAQG